MVVDSSRVVLGLGCNLGDRLNNLRLALQKIASTAKVRIEAVSSVYYSKAQLPKNASSDWDRFFLNLAILIATDLSPSELLAQLQAIEKEMGRQIERATWAPRVIDIDILLWEGVFLANEKLNIPHPRLLDRPFALWPAAEVVPDLIHTSNKQGQPKNLACLAAESSENWGDCWQGKAPFNTRRTPLRAWGTELMGIINITPDSFSDGGDYADSKRAWQRAKELYNSGVDLIDVGAESTNPSATPLDAETEWQRLEPFLQLWQKARAWWEETVWQTDNMIIGDSKLNISPYLVKPRLSIDSYHPTTLRRLLKYPIDFFNLVLDIPDSLWQELAAGSRAKFIFTHNLGLPCTGHVLLDESPIETILTWGEKMKLRAKRLGISLDRLVLDVGIGFGKTTQQNWQIIQHIKEFKKWQLPILVGHSRKSFLKTITDSSPNERDLETAALSGYLASKGIDYLRVHNPAWSNRVLNLQRALQS